jgi:hypothetical protein
MVTLIHGQLLWSLAVASLADEVDDLSDDGRGPSVQRQSLVLFRRPAIGVSGQESLSSSDEDESRLSPVRGLFGRGELSTDEKVELDFWRDSCSGDMLALEEEEKEEEEEVLTIKEWWDADTLESVVAVEEATDEMVDRVEVEDSRSEWAIVYLVVVISSSSGVRKQTCFSAGNIGRVEAILRGIIERAGLFVRMEVRLWGCL